MKLTLTNANTAYVAPARTVTPTGPVQSFSYCAIVNATAGLVFCGKSALIVSGGYPATQGLPIAIAGANTPVIIIPTKSQLFFSAETAGVVVDYEYF